MISIKALCENIDLVDMKDSFVRFVEMNGIETPLEKSDVIEFLKISGYKFTRGSDKTFFKFNVSEGFTLSLNKLTGELLFDLTEY